MFNADPEEGAAAIILDNDDDEEDGDVTVIDLEPLAPSMLKTPFGEYLNLSDLSWMNLATLLAIFQAGDMEVDNQMRAYQTLDAHGHVLLTPDTTDEAFKIVVRGGKKMKLPLVRRKRKKRLTPNQRAGLRKAKRTKLTQASKRKRALSLKLRKRLNLKKTKTPKGFRVGS
jgi:hypothetical protein